MNKKNILIVGGNGYLGRHLVQSLDNQKFNITFTGTKDIVHSSNYRTLIFENEFTYENITDKWYNLVFILASKLDSLGTRRLDHPDFFTNTIPYAKFLNFLSDKNLCEKLIYISSMTVYSRNNQNPVSEESMIEPVNTYGFSKYIAELITKFNSETDELKSVVIRIPGIFGGDRKNGFIYNNLLRLKKNKIIKLDTCNLIYWETIYVWDLVKIIVNFIDVYNWEKRFDVFNISYGQKTDLYETIFYLKRKLNSKSIIVEESSKGYIPFYLSNQRLKKYVDVQYDYFSSLDRYIQEYHL